MTLTLELTDEQARALKAQAEARGLSIEQLAQERVLHEDRESESWAHLQQDDPEEWSRRFHEWVQSHDRTTPILSDWAVSRDSIYD
jgi:hypothetical protein